MSIVTTAKFGNEKKKNFFEDILGKFYPIWTGAYGLESQLSEKNMYMCVYTLLWKNLT